MKPFFVYEFFPICWVLFVGICLGYEVPDEIESIFHPENVTKRIEARNTSSVSFAEGGVITQKAKEGASLNISVPIINITKVEHRLDNNSLALLDLSSVSHESKASKIIARKGVLFKPDLLNDTCLVIEHVACFNISSHGDCSCCSNASGMTVIEKTVMNCSGCGYNVTNEIKADCPYICCKNKTNETESQSTEKPISSTLAPIVLISSTTATSTSPPKIKKPIITQVPDDIINVGDSSLKSETEIVIPIIASIIVIPMLGVIILLIYKRTKDFWEKRHYNRMDFLIDGIYND